MNFILNNFYIWNHLLSKHVSTRQEIKEFFGDVRIYEFVSCLQILKTLNLEFFNFRLNSIFRVFTNNSKTILAHLPVHFFIFCLTLQENRLFHVKKSWKFHFLLKGKEFLTQSMLCGWKSVHLFKTSSISWRVGNHFEQKFQWEKLFRMIYSIL